MVDCTSQKIACGLAFEGIMPAERKIAVQQSRDCAGQNNCGAAIGEWRQSKIDCGTAFKGITPAKRYRGAAIGGLHRPKKYICSTTIRESHPPKDQDTKIRTVAPGTMAQDTTIKIVGLGAMA